MEDTARFSSTSEGLNWVTGLELPTSGRGLDQDGPPGLSLTTAAPPLSTGFPPKLWSGPLDKGQNLGGGSGLAWEPESQSQVRSDTFATKTLQQKIHRRESCRTRVPERRESQP